jgi:4-amino-4-deoxy-L-arabinose transferase-like glycosyltransferase
MKNIFKKDWFWLSAILLLGLSLRLYLLGFLRSLTFDEIASVSESSVPFGRIWNYVKWEMSPPLHFYYLHFWMQIFGSSEISLHFSSLILSLAAIIALYFLGKEIFKSGVAGLAAAFLYACSPLFCYYGIWTRMISLLFLSSVLSFLFFLKLINSRGKKIIIFGAFFVLATLAALLTHLTAGLVVIIEILYLLFLVLAKKNSAKELLKNFSVPALIIFLGYLPWFWYFWQSRLKNLSSDAWYFTSQAKIPLPYFMVYSLNRYLTPFSGYFYSLLALVIIATLFFFAFINISWIRGGGWQWRLFFSRGLFFSSAIIIISFVGLYSADLIVLRYAVIPAIGLFLILGFGFSRANRFWQVMVLFIFLLLSILSFKNINSAMLVPAGWKGGAFFIEQNEKPGDKIVTSLYFNLLVLKYYYHGALPATAPLDNKYFGDDLLATVIKTNVYPTTNLENVGQLKNYLASTSRIFFMLSSGEGNFVATSKIAEDWLFTQGFVRTKTWPPGDSSSSLVWIMERKNKFPLLRK